MNIYQNARQSNVGDRIWEPTRATAISISSQRLNGEYTKLQMQQQQQQQHKQPPPLAVITSPGIVTTTTTTMTTNLNKTAKTIITFIADYFEDSNIHGLQYVVKGGLTTIEK